MKPYERIAEHIIDEVLENNSLGRKLLMDVPYWLEYRKTHRDEIAFTLNRLKEEYPTVSQQYLYFLDEYYLPVLGAIDMYVIQGSEDYQSCTVLNNYYQTKRAYHSLLPISNTTEGDYIYLNERGEVIQLVGVGQTSIPAQFFTEIPKEEFMSGVDVAYLDYPDKNGLYQMYILLSYSFDEFMNEYVFGEGYLDLVEKKDDFYFVVKNIRETLGMKPSRHSADTSWGKQIKESLKSAPEGADVNIDFKIK